MKRLWVVLVVLVGFRAGHGQAQSDLDRAKNLATCLEGRYSILCKRSWLSPQELQKAEGAERRENLKTCMSGRYTSLCKKQWLSSTELKDVLVAERSENLKTCLEGRYKSLCNKNLLTGAELEQVVTAESRENLKTCLSGLYRSLCDHASLTPPQLAQVKAAESAVAAAGSQQGGVPSSKRVRRGERSGCEDGHWIESVLSDGSIIKLEDGSVWEVEAGDTVDSALWLPVSNIIACDDKLINTGERGQSAFSERSRMKKAL